MKKIDSAKIEKAVEMIIEAIGEDKNRDGLLDTPKRVAKMYEELAKGYAEKPQEHLGRTFENAESDLVIERDIAFSSTCEHHLMPFLGKAHIVYIPDGKVVGLSKLARVVEVFARRLQLQERMNTEIADSIQKHLKPKAVGVVLEAEHTCMTARGVNKPGSKTYSCVVRGEATPALLQIVASLMK